ncbi:DEAD/DEAH box helicase [Clostridium sp.]|uniref:DEAD/DEAH box helicase n=1 Tax=Clostridium sp. TaxID=1506 RepID=UPI002606954A|nr:DEAD/DEAH box helicase [Clostridium sp.]
MRKLTVNEIIKSKGIMLHKGKINLIIAPAGSGKTYYIFNTLLDVTKKSVYLCDTSNLQEMILKDKEIIGKVKSTGFDMIEGFYIDGFNCTVMTYAKWFYEMNKEEYKDVETIICDEIHNLYKYKDKFDKEEDKENGIKECKNYENVISNLHQNAKNGVQVVGFTATHERIKREMNFLLPKDDSNITNATNEKWNVINLSNEKNIRRLTSDFTFFFNNYRNLGHYLKVFNGFKYGKKALIYTNRVTECEDMINICNSIGLKSIALWSINNTKNPMNEEQLEVRESILTTGIIPRDYQILIINGAYETGINILDEDIEIMVCNDTQADTQIQSRSRIRKNIKAEIFKDKNCLDDIRIVVPEEYLNRKLTTKDKSELCKIVNVYGEKKSILKWTSIKPIIINSGYEVEDNTISIKKKNDTRVSTIIDVNPDARIIK